MVRANKWADWLDAVLKGGIVDVHQAKEAEPAPVQNQSNIITAQYQNPMQMQTATTYIPRKIMVSAD